MKQATGKVYLVGSGPGDPELLTLKARRLLETADLIIYDYLANPQHLEWARADARKICVGKGFRFRKVSQDMIHRMIIAAARRGRQVVRLKGGDPYLFARGAEEALALAGSNIPFEVVPGVTSATACGAYAGVPLTHRAFNASVTFLTGHRAHDEHLDSVQWEKIVALEGTIVIYMGFYNLGIIAERLISAGMSPDAKIAVVEWGSLPRQRSVDGTLSTIERLTRDKALKAPAIILIGEVVGLRSRLNWYESLPLFGKTVLVTRMREKAGELSERLRRLGAAVLECPVIEIKPAPPGPIDKTIRELERYDWLVFASAYGVDAFFERLKALKRDARHLGQLRVAAVGPGTACRLARYGVRADARPDRYEAARLVPAMKLKDKNLKHKKVLLMRTDIAPPELDRALLKVGARVTRVTAYRTARPASLPADVRRAMRDGSIDWLTFTSASSVDNLARLAGRAAFKACARRARIASIGPVTSRALARHGLKGVCQAEPFTIEGLVRAMEKRS